MEFRALAAIFSELIGAVAASMLLGLNPKFKNHPPLGFRYPKREGWFSLFLLSGLFMIAFLVWAGTISLPGIIPADHSAKLDGLERQAVLTVFGLLVFAAALFYRKQPLRSAGWNRPLLRPAFQAGFALLLLSLFLRGKAGALFDGISTLEGSALLVALLLGLGEETIFRGYVQLRLSSWLGKTPGWLAAAVLSALWQLPRLLSAVDTQMLLTQLGLALARGLVYGWMTQKYQHVLPAVMAHTASLWADYL